jgi:hypothetical protein
MTGAGLTDEQTGPTAHIGTGERAAAGRAPVGRPT